jgi:type II restriction/modification system DNA methylase subunit YeeA
MKDQIAPARRGRTEGIEMTSAYLVIAHLEYPATGVKSCHPLFECDTTEEAQAVFDDFPKMAYEVSRSIVPCEASNDDDHEEKFLHQCEAGY